jgi:hypothetical protein
MALYDTLFAMMDLQAAQLLVTPRDFRDENFKINLRETTEELLSVSRVVPVFNENDAVSDRTSDRVTSRPLLNHPLILWVVNSKSQAASIAILQRLGGLGTKAGAAFVPRYQV